MIAAQELRIGNLVNDEGGQPMYIGGIVPVGEQYKVVDSAGNICSVEQISGIHISDKILNKCDFGDEYLFYDGYLYRITVTGSQVWIGECKYLHQLQNLFFCLTGQQLTINQQH